MFDDRRVDIYEAPQVSCKSKVFGISVEHIRNTTTYTSHRRAWIKLEQLVFVNVSHGNVGVGSRYNTYIHGFPWTFSTTTILSGLKVRPQVLQAGPRRNIG